MNYRNISNLNDIIINNINILPMNIDLIVGIPRSGMLPANLIALYRNLPFCDFDTFLRGDDYSAGARLKNFKKEKIKNVLIVDDSIWSGSALSKIKEQLVGVELNYQIKFAAIYVKPGSEKLIDHYFELLDTPRIFQWNFFHHNHLNNSCVDIDGVLCVDPTEEENDDGKNYIHFLKNAKPLYVPSVKIHTLVSCRLEKYRKLTEEWLRKYNIQYKKLKLLDLPNKKARIKLGNHAEYKANIYSKSACDLFVESSLCQANIINNKTKKQVFCVENFTMLKISKISNCKNKYNFSKILKRIKKIKNIINY